MDNTEIKSKKEIQIPSEMISEYDIQMSKIIFFSFIIFFFPFIYFGLIQLPISLELCLQHLSFSHCQFDFPHFIACLLLLLFIYVSLLLLTCVCVLLS